MAEESGDKSQDATPHRREQAREEGQVAQSQDMASAALLVLGILVLLFAGSSISNFLGRTLVAQLGGDAWLSITRDQVIGEWTNTTWGLSKALGPVLGMFFIAGIAVHLAQIGFLFVPNKLAFDLSKLNPIEGLQRLFSMTNVVRLAFGIFKVAIVAIVAYWTLYSRWNEVLGLAELDLPQIAVFTWEICLWTALKIGAALLILGILDYGYQWWKSEQDLKMTPQEVREEMKTMQGDPHVLSRRRSIQRQMATQALKNMVPKADVVITNPTELAVAIQYEPETMNAPIMVAKGAGVLAQRIRQLALEHGVPIIEKKPLAQSLYKEVDLNKPIPDKMYAAVAEVLAYVYQLKGKPLPVTRT